MTDPRNAFSLDAYLADLAPLINLDCGTRTPAGVARVADIMTEKYEAIGWQVTRHQFAADLKANGDDEATSRGLGHISAETRRVYGTASQASKRYRLRPLRIEVERPVKPRSRGPCTKWRNEPA